MIHQTTYQEVELTVMDVSESVSAEEVLETLEAFYDAGPTKFVLWDFTRVDVTTVDFEGVQAIAKFTAAHGDRRPGGRTAIVTSQQVTFGIDRVYESALELHHSPLEVKVFWSVEDGLEFLGIDEMPGGSGVSG